MRRNSYSIAPIFVENIGRFGKLKIIGLDQGFLHETALFYQNILGFSLIVGVADFEKEMEDGNIVMELKKGQKLDWVNMKMTPKDPASEEFMFQSRKSLEHDVPALEGVSIGASQTLYLRTKDVDAHFESIKDKVEVIQVPITRFYGIREWYFKDINGYILCYGQELANE